MTHYKANVLFEISFDTGGNNYLIIYGRHINGYFCCIPNWHVGCEMAEPTDVFYNRSRLVNDACLSMNAADAIAKAIKETSEEMEKKPFYAVYEQPGEILRSAIIFAKDSVAAFKEAEDLKCDDEKFISVYSEEEFAEIYGGEDI